MVNQSQHLSPAFPAHPCAQGIRASCPSQTTARERQQAIRDRKTVSFEEFTTALGHIAGCGDDIRINNARTLGHAEVMLWSALFGTAEDWQRVRNILIDHMEVKA